MKKIGLVFAVALLASGASAKQKPIPRDTWLGLWASKPVPCGTAFSVSQTDTLGNSYEGLGDKQVRWLSGHGSGKYANICYAPPGLEAPVRFRISVTPATYYGTRVVTNEKQQESPITLEDEDLNVYHGTVETTTSTSTAVPYSFRYGIYTLTLETRNPDGTWRPRHHFQQSGLYRLVYGIPVGKGKDPDGNVILQAVKWIYQGGLTNPFEGVAR